MKLVRFKKAFLILCITVLAAASGPAAATAADVDVYGEGAINGTELTVYLYADVNVDNVLSYGVKLTYDPAALSVNEVQKDPSTRYTSNETKWYLGDTSATYRNNPNPDTSVDGEITIIGGKLDPANPTEGVLQGTRVLIAMVKFDAAGTEIPANPSLSIEYAVGTGAADDTYKNFVRLNAGTPESLDETGVSFGTVKVCPRGDASEDGLLDSRDIRALRGKIGTPDLPVWNDCSADGIVDSRDIRCLRGKI